MPKTLLVADDSVVIQKLVGLSFANEDVELVTTDNGTDAIAMARELKPNLVLADVVMPGKSGYDVCEEIKRDPELSHIHVLLLTGTFEAFDEARAQQVSADGHITKPFEAQVLVEKVNALLKGPSAPGNRSAAEAPATDSGGDYDFFEEKSEQKPEPASLQTSPHLADPGIAPANFDDDLLQFGEPLETAPLSAPPEIDRTIAMMPDVPLTLDPVSPPPIASDSLGPDILAVESVDPVPAPPTAPGSEHMPDPGLTVLAGFDLGTGEDSPLSPPADDVLLADDFSFESAMDSRPIAIAPMLGDDLFGDAPASSSATTASNSFDFGAADSPLASSSALLGPESLSQSPAASVAGSPVEIGDASFALDPPDANWGSSVEQLEIDPLGDIAPELLSDLDSDALQSPPLPVTDAVAAMQAPSENQPDTPLQAESLPMGPGPDLGPLLRERLHDTIEKVAWEAFADISDAIVRQVIEKVESVAWEVIPQMTEMMIQEEIRRMKGEAE